MVSFLPCETTGWISGISLWENSINQSINQTPLLTYLPSIFYSVSFPNPTPSLGRSENVPAPVCLPHVAPLTGVDGGTKIILPYIALSSSHLIDRRVLFKENLNASRPSKHPPVRGEHVKTFRWDLCVCVFFPSILDIKFVGRTSRGHTGGRSHRIFNPPSFCGACLDFCREKDSAIPFPRRP